MWLSVLLVRLLGEAAGGNIGADVVLVLAALSTITALPTILAVSVFIAVLTTVTRNYRESEMVVWFASGLSLADWFKPVLRVAIPVAIAVAGLTLFAAPWAYRQIGEYHQRFEQRSDLSKVTAGQFAESAGGDRVFFAEDPAQPTDELGNVFARETGPEWLSVLSASSAHSETLPNGDRFLVLGAGHRYDLPGTPEIRLVNFESTGCAWKARPAAIRWPRRARRPSAPRRAPRGSSWPTIPTTAGRRSCGACRCRWLP